ncbi:MAG TPA: hypothetical protein VNT77_06815, partial [Allosphingosinicella sp.]|nr:hypothetical protein [Allosphingosinicella sp.]
MERRSDRFAGASFKLPLGGLTGTKPTARLQFGMRHVYKDARAVAPAATYNVAALEIGASSAGKPALFVGGRELSKVDQRLNAQGGSTALIIGGVVLLALVGIAVVAWSQDEDDTLEW